MPECVWYSQSYDNERPSKIKHSDNLTNRNIVYCIIGLNYIVKGVSIYLVTYS